MLRRSAPGARSSLGGPSRLGYLRTRQVSLDVIRREPARGARRRGEVNPLTRHGKSHPEQQVHAAAPPSGRVVADHPAWSDGLPLIEPSAEQLTRMLASWGLDRATVFGPIPPAFQTVTVDQLAEVAVMAGCRPEYLPLVEASLRACLSPDFNLLGIQTTTEPPTPLLIVNGPIRCALQMNSGANVLGQGNPANASIGRALRLLLTRFGNAIPGVTDMATFGHPGKYTYCIAENEERNPWPPFHTERSFRVGESVVTTVGADAPVNVNCASENPEDILGLIAQSMAIPGSNNVLFGGEIVVVLSPQHATALARASWSKAAVREYLFDHGSVSTQRIPPGVLDGIRRSRGRAIADEPAIPSADSPEAILLLVAGGLGAHSAVIPTFGATRACSAAITWKSSRSAGQGASAPR